MIIIVAMQATVSAPTVDWRSDRTAWHWLAAALLLGAGTYVGVHVAHHPLTMGVVTTFCAFAASTTLQLAAPWRLPTAAGAAGAALVFSLCAGAALEPEAREHSVWAAVLFGSAAVCLAIPARGPLLETTISPSSGPRRWLGRGLVAAGAVSVLGFAFVLLGGAFTAWEYGSWPHYNRPDPSLVLNLWLHLFLCLCTCAGLVISLFLPVGFVTASLLEVDVRAQRLARSLYATGTGLWLAEFAAIHLRASFLLAWLVD